MPPEADTVLDKPRERDASNIHREDVPCAEERVEEGIRATLEHERELRESRLRLGIPR